MQKDKFKSEFSGSKDKKSAIDKSASSQDKIGRVKIDQNFEVNKADQIDLELDSDNEEQHEGGDKSKPAKPKEEKKQGKLAGLKGSIGNVFKKSPSSSAAV